MTRQKALLIDFTRCIGCGACMEACADQNGLAAPTPSMTDLSSDNFTIVKEHNGQFYRRQCMHCNDPVCASVCPVGAFTKHKNGAVTYEPEKCMGCRYCMEACPFKVPTYEWGKAVPKVRKCILCFDRIEAGGRTACAWVCPTGATRFGDKQEIIQFAEYMIDSEPNKYIHHIYGLDEAGGTTVLMLSKVPFEELGFPINLGEQSLPELTEKVLRMIPNIAITAGIMFGGIWWVINRRIELEKHHKKMEKLNKDENKEYPNE
ncbi:MAG: 4Fe-4S dicluster domain-containing protein [Deltaproteobacteria bacterium]|nr:4Fe-4S dicluster domain-containing protein [Deltaproteobacteria bacterium]